MTNPTTETAEPKRDALYANDAAWAAFYRDGKNLGEIAKQFDCNVYDLSPWLTAQVTSVIMDALTHRTTDPEWQPIATAPKDGTPVDLWGINHLRHGKTGERIVNVRWGAVTNWMGQERDDWQHGRGEDFEPTHWMFPPKPPSEGDPA